CARTTKPLGPDDPVLIELLLLAEREHVLERLPEACLRYHGRSFPRLEWRIPQWQLTTLRRSFPALTVEAGVSRARFGSARRSLSVRACRRASGVMAETTSASDSSRS